MNDTFETVLAAVVGAMDLDRTDAGVLPRRLPAWTRTQLLDPGIDWVASMPSGVRIELTTDADWLELDVLPTLLPMEHGTWRPAVFDLVVDGRAVASRSVEEGRRLIVNAAGTGFEVLPSEPVTLRFDLPRRPSAVEVWLPHACHVRLVDARVPAGATVRPTPQIRPLWAHYGSSISHCQEAATPTATWPALVARTAGVRLQSLGLSGQCQLDQFAARTLRDLPADAISMKVGINLLNGDSMRERAFVSALHGFLDTVRDGHPTTPLVVCTPIWCPSGEGAPGPTAQGADGRFFAVARPPELADGALTLTLIRSLIARVVQDRADANLHLLNGLDLFGPADAEHMPDDLHPDTQGYALMAERFLPLAFGSDAPFGNLGTQAPAQAGGIAG